MSEYWFYHLQSRTVESVLPELLEKAWQKNWRCLVKVPSERLADMDQFLWTYRDNSFLAHGRDDEPRADVHPIILSSTTETSDGFECAFLVEGMTLDIAKTTQRCIILINGRHDADVKLARQQWAELKKTGSDISYWQQNDQGRWEKRA